MSMQIMVGINLCSEIEFIENQKEVNLTDDLKEICGKYLTEKRFFEDSEEIMYRIISSESIQKVNKEMDDCVLETISNIKATKGNEAKKTLVEKLRDYSLLKTQIIEMLLLIQKGKDAVLVLV